MGALGSGLKFLASFGDDATKAYKEAVVRANKNVQEQTLFQEAGGMLDRQLKKTKFGNSLRPGAETRKRVTVKPENPNEVASNIRKSMEGIEDEAVRGNMEKMARSLEKRGVYKRDQTFLEKSAAYFDDPVNGTNRTIAAGVGIGGAIVGGRVLTGGNLTHNGDGKKDIMGVPFI